MLSSSKLFVTFSHIFSSSHYLAQFSHILQILPHAAVKLGLRGLVKGQLKHHTSLNFQ